MTELETHLLKSLDALWKKYQADGETLAKQVSSLSKQVSSLSEQLILQSQQSQQAISSLSQLLESQKNAIVNLQKIMLELDE